MTLMLMEGFENEITGAVLAPGWTGTAGTLGAASGRFGSGGYTCTTTSGAAMYRALTPSATLIVGLAFKITAGGAANATSGLGLAADNAATNHLSISFGSDGSVSLRRGDTLGTIITTTVGGVVSFNNWHYLEIKGTIADSGGVAIVKLNGAEIINYTGDTRNGGTSTDFDSIRLGGRTINLVVDDIYVCNGSGTVNNDFLGDSRVMSLLPNGNGNSSQGVGSDADSIDNYALVDEAAPSGADYVALGLGNKDTYTYSNIGFTPTTVHGVMVTTNALKSDTGAASAAAVARLSGTESTGTAIALSTSSVPQFEVFEAKPGGGAWTGSDVDSAEFGAIAS